ncbi:hypothetical protein ZIOFF_055123 [Zingiber officinale]|uniref:protein-serine/threonine phosphatase n=2 Tax=Zingiber officinale TaxID=94328 RepID=A0A8J5KN98_ZINOF|nr:hypothetical protein ZIOFF_055123 [Zingiber officinale]
MINPQRVPPPTTVTAAEVRASPETPNSTPSTRIGHFSGTAPEESMSASEPCPFVPAILSDAHFFPRSPSESRGPPHPADSHRDLSRSNLQRLRVNGSKSRGPRSAPLSFFILLSTSWGSLSRLISIELREWQGRRSCRRSNIFLLRGKKCFAYCTVLVKQAKAGFGSSSETGRGKAKICGKSIRHGYHMVKGKSNHPMEDYLVAEFKKVGEYELGLFAIFDGHLGQNVADYLRANLFENILNEPDFWTDIESAIKKAYERTDTKILEKQAELGRGGSTAVTAILIDGVSLVVANIGDSRAVISKNGVAIQLSIDHEPSRERHLIEEKGGFVTSFPGDVPRVDGRLAVARAFGDRSLKAHLTSEPDVADEIIDEDAEFLILASDGLWKVMSNQEAVDFMKDIKDPQTAARSLTEEAVARKSRDDISCIVVKFN